MRQMFLSGAYDLLNQLIDSHVRFADVGFDEPAHPHNLASAYVSTSYNNNNSLAITRGEQPCEMHKILNA